MQKVFLATCLTLIAGSAFAGGDYCAYHTCTRVPEIDALSGLAAVAAVGGAFTLMWERRRRR